MTDPTKTAEPTLAERVVAAVLVASWLAVLLTGFWHILSWAGGLPIDFAEIVLFDISSIAIAIILLNLGRDIIVVAVQRVFRSTRECQQ